MGFDGVLWGLKGCLGCYSYYRFLKLFLKQIFIDFYSCIVLWKFIIPIYARSAVPSSCCRGVGPCSTPPLAHLSYVMLEQTILPSGLGSRVALQGSINQSMHKRHFCSDQRQPPFLCRALGLGLDRNHLQPT